MMEPGTATIKADNCESVVDDCQKQADVALDVLDKLLSVKAGKENEKEHSTFLVRLKKLLSSLQAVRSRVEDVEARLGLPL